MQVCPGSARGTSTLELPNSFTVKSASASHGAEAVEFTTRREPQGDGASVEQFSEVIIPVWRYLKRNHLCRKKTFENAHGRKKTERKHLQYQLLRELNNSHDV